MGITQTKGKTVKAKEEELILLSISKSDEKESFSFKKQQIFFPFLLKLLLDLGFDRQSIYLQYFFGISLEEFDSVDETYFTNPFSQEYLEIGTFKNHFENIVNEDFDVEVIFFESKIYLIIRKLKKSKKDLGKIISNYCKFQNE